MSLPSAALLLVAVLLFGGCGLSEPDDLLRMGLSNAPVNLDPRIAADADSARVNRLLYARLVEFGPGDRPLPGLVHWERPAPGHYRLRLRDGEGRRFSHGRRLQAEDVAATLESIRDPATGSPYRTQLAAVTRIEVSAPEVIDVWLERPDPGFPARLALEVLPAELIAGNHPFHRRPVGSGPFELDQWPESGRLILRRREDGQLIELVQVKDPGVRVMKLLRGEIDLLQNDLSPELFRFLEARPAVTLNRRAGSNFTYLGFNLEDARLSDVRVRRALALAIDRRAIIRHVLAGGAEPAQALFPPRHWAGAKGLPVFERDLPQSRALLREAGYGPERPLELEYKTSTDPFRVRLATILQAQLAEAGVRVRVRSLDWGTFFGDIKGGRFQMYSLTWVGVKTPDHFRYVFHSESVPPKGANRGRYRSVEADRLIERAEAVEDLTDQARLYAELQRLLLEDLPYIPLWYEDQVAALGEGIAGYRVAADGNFDGLRQARRVPAAGEDQ